jgi:hypothetical protein
MLCFYTYKNAEGMAVCFDTIRNYTVDIKCAKEVKIKSVVYVNQRVAVVFCITADDHRLPPYILFSIAKRYLRMKWFINSLLCVHKK